MNSCVSFNCRIALQFHNHVTFHNLSFLNCLFKSWAAQLIVSKRGPQTIRKPLENNNFCKYLIMLNWKVICLSYNLTNANSHITTAILLGSVLTYLVVLFFCPSSLTAFLALVTWMHRVPRSMDIHREAQAPFWHTYRGI